MQYFYYMQTGQRQLKKEHCKHISKGGKLVWILGIQSESVSEKNYVF